jgi:cyclophilin family peptidyl-prolyl cis-trans isomerase
VPSDKRARQRAGREARRLVEAKRDRRRKLVRRSITIVVVAVVVVGSVYLITKPKAKAPLTAQQNAQAAANAIAVKAGCPASPTSRVNTLQFKKPTQVIDPSDNYSATVKTTVGTFVITLDPKAAPIAVNSFVFLADKHFYNCVIFHRVITGSIDQTGDPTGTPVASPQYPVGSVALANSDSPETATPKTNGSQFFIVTGGSYQNLPPDYVLFGKVTSGMKVVDKINTDGSTSGVPPKIVQRMLSVTIHES